MADKTTAAIIGGAALLAGALGAPLILPDGDAQEPQEPSKYVATMYYEGRTEPAFARVVRVQGSRLLAESEIDHALVICESAADVVLDLPDVRREVRGFRVANAGTGRLTLRAPEDGTVAGRELIVLKPGEALEGAPKAEARAEAGKP